MIRLGQNLTFTAPVEIAVPGCDEPARSNFEFRVLDRQRLAQLLIIAGIARRNRFVRLFAYLQFCWRLRRAASVVDTLDEIIIGWDSFDVPYSRDALRIMLEEFPGAWLSIFSAFLTGYKDARIKN